MDGSPSSILMVGFGNGTFNGSPSLIMTLGFGVGEEGVVIEPTLFAAMPFSKCHGLLPENRGHFSLPRNNGHLTIPDQL